jgi:EpsI family protein
MRWKWAPAIVLTAGCILTLGAAKQREMPLEHSIHQVIPVEILGFAGQDLAVSDAEADIAGFSNYLFRVYERPAGDSPAPSPAEGMEQAPWFSLYVGYYTSQTRGKTIHSPKNCMPGAGWEALSSEGVEIDLGDRKVTVNRYILQNGEERVLALYWYQGRGRVAHNEYLVKVNLLLDAALRRRSDEALVRIIVPMNQDPEGASVLANRLTTEVIPQLERALPR